MYTAKEVLEARKWVFAKIASKSTDLATHELIAEGVINIDRVLAIVAGEEEALNANS
jgi:hypothetical protein